MTDVKRTLGQAEGTEQEIDIALDESCRLAIERGDRNCPFAIPPSFLL